MGWVYAATAMTVRVWRWVIMRRGVLDWNEWLLILHIVCVSLARSLDGFFVCAQETNQYYQTFFSQLREKAVGMHAHDRKSYLRLEQEHREYKRQAEDTITVRVVAWRRGRGGDEAV